MTPIVARIEPRPHDGRAIGEDPELRVRANAKSIVALDLGQVLPGRKPTAAVLAELACGRCRRSCSPAMLSLHSAGIESLSLDLHRLGALRALDVSGNRVDAGEARYLEAWTGLEVLGWRFADVPAGLRSLKKLRYLDVSDAETSVKVPETVDALEVGRVVPDVERCELRFFHREASALEHVSVWGDGALPAHMKRCRKLRALHVENDQWLTDLDIAFLRASTSDWRARPTTTVSSNA